MNNSTFNILRNCQIAFQSIDTIFIVLPTIYKVPISPYPCQCISLCVFLIITILEGVKWYVIVGLFSLSLMTTLFTIFLKMYEY
jgi:hypothetical protein